MRTNFTLDQLRDPATKESERIIRTCVHCGFCTATCPTYVLLGDELDSPRGRIYLIQDMLEHDRPATEEVVKHIDRCLSCLACMTTCPSGVHYMHLVDHARVHIERTYRRPVLERAFRALLARVLARPALFRVALWLAFPAKPLARVFAAIGPQSLAALLRLAPAGPSRPQPGSGPGRFPVRGDRKGRVALLSGCVNQVVAPHINQAAINLLNRHGIEVVLPEGEGCCGALSHHLGRDGESLGFVRRNIDAWTSEVEREGLDAILITASGCGTMVKDYGFLLRSDRLYAKKAQRISALTKDVSEYLATLDLMPAVRNSGMTVAYHSACSLQHGQRVAHEPKALLVKAGFEVRDVPEGHLCCGSAGTYNMLEPAIARRLAERKAANIAKVAPDVIAAGNIGCMTQLELVTKTPIVHTVELLDWATGGSQPQALRRARSGKDVAESLESTA
jgi:glycolate dehydrogenase iron-sulfur subunit